MMRVPKSLFYLALLLLLAGAGSFYIHLPVTATPSESPAARISLVATSSMADASSSISESPFPSGSHVTIGMTVIPVELATSSEVQSKGLSGRASLDVDRGMLFIFVEPARYSFWMPDMHFPIDIIWIDQNKVVDITSDVSNQFDFLHPRFYLPSVPARYVLEVNAGFAKQHAIVVGDSAVLQIPAVSDVSE